LIPRCASSGNLNCNGLSGSSCGGDADFWVLLSRVSGIMAGEGGTIFLPNVGREGEKADVPEWIYQSPPNQTDMSRVREGSPTRSLTSIDPDDQRIEALQTLKSVFKTPSQALKDLVEITKRAFKSDIAMLTMVCPHGPHHLVVPHCP